MDSRVEFLIAPRISRQGGPMLEAMYRAAIRDGVSAIRTERYSGESDWLMLYGVGAPANAPVRDSHVASGRTAILWDVGYFGRRKRDGYLRVSIDHDHPQAWLDRTPVDASRWEVHGISLREDFKPGGHIVLVGLGRKSRAYLGQRGEHWERDKLAELRRRFPGADIVHRPKKRHIAPGVKCRVVDDRTPIEALLEGAALVVCRHSNVAIDAAIAGVPYECEDGAAMWLAARPFTVENRLTFLRALAWWQWRIDEAPQAWAFLREVIGASQSQAAA